MSTPGDRDRTGLRVGVCEDHEPIRKVLVRGLRQAGHEVLAAHDGHEALVLLGADAPLDVIVMDVGLPDADGRDVVAALKSAGQQAPVLFLTALGATHEVLAGFAAGGDDYVVKPFDLAEVLARLDALGAPRPAPAARSPTSCGSTRPRTRRVPRPARCS